MPLQRHLLRGGFRIALLKKAFAPLINKANHQCIDRFVLQLWEELYHSYPLRRRQSPTGPQQSGLLQKSDLQALIDKITGRLTVWKAPLLTRAWRLVKLNSVLTPSLVYQMVWLDQPPWSINCIVYRQVSPRLLLVRRGGSRRWALPRCLERCLLATCIGAPRHSQPTAAQYIRLLHQMPLARESSPRQAIARDVNLHSPRSKGPVPCP